MKSEGEAYLLLGMLIDGFCGGHVPNVSSYTLWICLLACFLRKLQVKSQWEADEHA
jgi:hypothetical protein